MCDKYGRPLSEILQLPAYELEWSSICFSIDDDLNDPEKRKKLLGDAEKALTNKQKEAKFRMEFD